MNNTNDQNRVLLDILKEAIAIEIYGKEYYSIFSELVEEEKAKAIFRGLARDEEGHKETLLGALYYLEQEGSWYGYSPPTTEG